MAEGIGKLSPEQKEVTSRNVVMSMPELRTCGKRGPVGVSRGY